MLLTRAPLYSAPKGTFSLDLHVLGTPPAFVLSQDQTLQFKSFSPAHDAPGRYRENSGGDLLSHTANHAVPSAQRGLTAEFGMGSGMAPSL